MKWTDSDAHGYFDRSVFLQRKKSMKWVSQCSIIAMQEKTKPGMTKGYTMIIKFSK